MKASFTVLLLVLGLSLVFAQETDHVYLKDGSIIRGAIELLRPGEFVKITDYSGNTWHYQMTAVEKITREVYQSLPPGIPDREAFRSGFVHLTSLGFLAGASSNVLVAPFSLLSINGYRSPSGFFAGAGLGIEFLNTSYLPLFLDLRYDISGKDVVPYALVRGGYTLPLSQAYSDYSIEYAYGGGPLLGAGFGLKIRSRKHFAWDMEILYRYMKSSYQEKFTWNEQSYEYTDIYNRVEIRLGFYID